MTKALLKRVLSVGNELMRRDTGMSLMMHLDYDDYEKFRMLMASYDLVESGGEGKPLALGYRKEKGTNYITIFRREKRDE